MEKLTAKDIQWIRSLHHKSGRKELGLFIVEGMKMLQEALSNQVFVIHLVVSDSEDVLQAISSKGHPTKKCSTSEMQRISNLKTASEVLVILKMQSYVDIPSSDQLIVLDNIQDPGNLGTIIRIADWFGIQHIVASENTVDIYNPKTIQATMGSIFRVKVHYTQLSEYLSKQRVPIYGAVMDGESIEDCSMSSPAILVIGNEGQGISNEVSKAITHPITIPKIGGAESLNAAVACGILVSRWNLSQK